ncbi:uncharacterized protein [Parasteatoda tepidariorum]|uniref:uncharacterized protein n=1 Tax=Parasteatoda tepidariorum TaxID=114398 RepID=UPI00077FA853|nr:uncharacterized protein LOC107455639 [Parasteatoda tepidariorum]
MDVDYVHRFREPPFTPPLAHRKTTGILIAVPFVVCFTIFGTFNLVGGTVLTIMACSSQLTPKAKAMIQRLVRRANIKLQPQINPMQVVGIILLLTGSLLVIIGLALGVIACRSVDEHERRRNERLGLSHSGIPLFSLAERSSRQALSLCSTSMGSNRSRNGKRSLVSEKTVSPILEVTSEEENMDQEEAKKKRKSEVEFILPTYDKVRRSSREAEIDSKVELLSEMNLASSEPQTPTFHPTSNKLSVEVQVETEPLVLDQNITESDL